MKIKTKKQLNLPQLIEWAWDNDLRDLSFRGHDKKGYVVSISINDKGEFTSDWRISKNDLFTVEVEEEITEDTKLDLIERFIGGTGSVCYTSHTMSINKCLRTAPSDITITHYYIENDDRELILIWRDGKLVD